MSGAADATDLKPLLAAVADGRSLSEAEAQNGFEIMMSGNATPAQMGAFLMALRVRGESVDEISGAARTMRAKAAKIRAPAGAMDIVGTGGDAHGTFNISTATALVVAGAGVPVAKHGNRAFTSKSGAADVLTALGVNLDCDFALIERSVAEAGVGFMMAPRHHSATRHVAGPRVELATRTIFNLLGPLSNPADVRMHLIGVYARKWIEPLATTLGKLGSTRAWVVHSADGLDEITTTAATHVAELADGRVRQFEIKPEDAGLKRASLSDLKGGTPQDNAAAITNLLAGKPGPFRDVALLNAAAALMVAGVVKSLADGAVRAANAIDQGRARAALAAMVAITNGPAKP